MTMCRAGLIVALLMLLAGCGHQDYSVVLTPQGQSVERRLEWSVNDGSTDAPPASGNADDQRLTALYHNAGKEESGRRVYVASFSGQLPGDIGGAGTYRRLDSDLGSLTLYSERFRGDDDVAGQVAAIQHAGDEFTDVLIGWFGGQMGADPRWPQLKAFFDKGLRNDVKSMALMLWRGRPQQGEDAAEKAEAAEIVAQLGQYLAEHGYVTIDELPGLARRLAAHSFENYGDEAVHLVQRLAARRMGVKEGEPIPASLAFLGDSGRATASLDAYLRTTPEYHAAVAAWEAKKAEVGGEKAGSAPEPESVIGDKLAPLVCIRINLFGGPDRISVELACPVEPLLTNGKWDAKARRVTWGQAGLGGKGEPPLYRIAVWVEPDEAAQKAHLGQAKLQNEDLAGYVVWHNGLTEVEAKEWRRFFADLKAGPNPEQLNRRIRDFHFSTQPGPTTQSATQPDDAVQTDSVLRSLMHAAASPGPATAP